MIHRTRSAIAMYLRSATKRRSSMVSKILIYRLGSLGDTVVALPCFHLIRRTFPDADIRVLTNFPISGKAPPLSSVLVGNQSGGRYFEYNIGNHNALALFFLIRSIRSWGPDNLIYLMSRNFYIDICEICYFFCCLWNRQIRRPAPEQIFSNLASYPTAVRTGVRTACTMSRPLGNSM